MRALPEVVRATVRGVPDVVAVFFPEGSRWRSTVCIDGYFIHGHEHVTDRRPLVLIDPEDDVQVVAFIEELRSHFGDVAGVRSALLSLVEEGR